MSLHFVKFIPLLLFFLLTSCGGGSTVTSVTLTAENTEVPLGGSTQITAKSETAITENVTGEKVHFTFRVNESGGRLDVVNDRLDGNKEAKAIYHAGTRPGNDVIQASFNSGATATTQIRVGTGQPVAPLSIAQIGTTTVRVTVTDSRGIPIPEANVDLSINIGTVSPTSGTTNANGILEANFTLPAGVTSATVTATVQGVTAMATVSTADTSVARIHLSQRGTTLSADGSVAVQVQATAYDRASRPVPSVQINFSIRGSGSVAPSQGNTDANGVLLPTVTLPAGVNSTQLVAISGSISQTLTVQRQPTQVASIVLEQFGNRVRATVADISGRPINGAEVNFAISTGTVTPSGRTDSNGIVEVPFVLPDGINTARLTAVSGNIEASLNVQRAHTQVATIRLEQFGSTILATASDEGGRPLQGVQVNFRITVGTIGSTGTTNDNGIVEVTFELPTGVNTARVMASSGNVSSTLDVVQTERSGANRSLPREFQKSGVATIRLEVDGPTARVWVGNAGGHPLESVPVRLSLSRGSVEPAEQLSNVNGLAEARISVPGVGQSLLTVESGGMTATFRLP